MDFSVILLKFFESGLKQKMMKALCSSYKWNVLEETKCCVLPPSQKIIHANANVASIKARKLAAAVAWSGTTSSFLRLTLTNISKL